MSNKVHILVAGDADEAAALFGKREAAGICFTCYAGGNEMATLLRQPGRRYDWIMVNAASFEGDEKDLIRSLRVTGSFRSEAHIREARPCGVEWLPDGSLQMHCCMRTAIRKSRINSQFDSVGSDSVVFEYQAPVKRAK